MSVTKNIFSLALALIVQWSLCQVSVAAPMLPPPTPEPIAGCWVSCSPMLIAPSDPRWILSVVGCTGTQICTVPLPIPKCPNENNTVTYTPGRCQPGGYRDLKPVFVPPPVANPKMMSCGEFGAKWEEQLKTSRLQPTLSGVTSVRKKECPYSYIKRAEGGLGPGWKNDRGWDPEGCVRTEIPTRDHKAAAGPDDQVCCLRQCPQDQWRMLLPGR